jgi:hypothetical protein
MQDFHLIKSTSPFKFEIFCTPYITPNEERPEENYIMKIFVEIDKNYPKQSPKITFDPYSNISQDNLAEIEILTERTLEKRTGIPIIFDIVESIRVILII